MFGLTTGMVSILASCLVGGVALQGVTIFSRPNQGNQLASGKFGSSADYKNIKGKDGVVLSKELQLTAKHSNAGVMIIAPSDSGKTTKVICPTIDSLSKQDNVLFISDPKGELYQGFADTFRECGKEVYRFHLSDSKLSHHFDPLTFCKDESEVMQLAQSILINGNKAMEASGKQGKDGEWLNLASPLLTSYLLLGWSNQFRKIYSTSERISSLRTPRNFVEILDFVVAADEETLKKTIYGNAYTPAIKQYNIYKKSIKSPKANANIQTTLSSAVKTLMTDPHLERIMSNNSIDPDHIRKTPKVIFVQYPVMKADYLSPFTSMMFELFMKRLIVEDETTVHEYQQVFFLLDELANLGKINSLPQFVTTCRSNGVSFVGAIQSIAQLVKVYGEKDAYIILDNMKTIAVLPGIKKDATLISELSGEHQIEIDGKIFKKPLLTAPEIRQLQDDEIAILTGNKPTFIHKSTVRYPIQKVVG